MSTLEKELALLVADYEKQSGKSPNRRAQRIMLLFLKDCELQKELGRVHAANNVPALGVSYFCQRLMYMLVQDDELTAEIRQHLAVVSYQYYMDGYSVGK